MPLAWFAIRHALVLGFVAATAWATGRIGIRALRLGPSTAPHAFTLAVGLAILAQGGLLLGLAGWLRTPVLALVALCLHGAALNDWRDLLAALGRAYGRRRLRSAATSALVIALGVPFFLPALYPPLGFDQTLYHLPFARAFAATGGVPFLPALRYPVFPQLAEVLDAAVLLFAGDVATQLVGWLALVACISLVFVWTRELSSPAGGWIGAATLAGSPIAFYLASTGYVEPLLALFGLAALYAATRATPPDPGTPTPDPRSRIHDPWLLLSGVLAGTAAGTKYLGLFFVPAAGVLLLSGGGWRITMRRLLLYGFAALAALAPSYGRLLAYTGNPLFPFYPDLFGRSPWEAQQFLGKHGIERLVAASTLLWDMTFRRHLVGAMPPFSPAFAVAPLVALIASWRRPGLRGLLLLAVGYILLAPVQSHYFFGIAPLWSVLIGGATATLAERRKRGRGALLALAVALALGGEAYAVYRVHRLGLPPATMADRERLLTTQLPLYPAVAFLNGVAPRTIVYGIGAENMVDYSTGTLLGDHNGPVSYSQIQDRVRARGSLAAVLDEIGASYFLVPKSPSVWTMWAGTDPRLHGIYEDSHAAVYRVLPAAAMR